jgi:hypothetical protein
VFSSGQLGGTGNGMAWHRKAGFSPWARTHDQYLASLLADERTRIERTDGSRRLVVYSMGRKVAEL